MVEYIYILLEFFSQDNFVSAGCDDLKLVTFTCDLLTVYIFHDFLYCVLIFYLNAKNINIGHFILGNALFHGILLFD